ncbi:MAG: glycosyltransferase [Muribaculaceae bacterium]|nr:glycosyltransferase [Muribaculaceae bacterium]MDE7080923.1 glycosyltransferase [Muribaculaceae bacterium]
MAKLQVMIATFGAEGLARVATMKLPALEGVVEYLVSCQIPEGEPPALPAALRRSDVDVAFERSRGVARNRNLLLSRWTSPYGLIADDDLDYTSASLLDVIAAFDDEPDLDFAAFMHVIADGTTEKPYPSETFDMARPAKGYFPTAPEFALRRASLLRHGIRYNERFGVGCERYASGEEDLLLDDMLRAGLRGRFIPLKLCVHHGATTGIRSAARPGVLRAQGAVLHRTHPLTAPLRLLLKARRTSRATGTPFAICLWHLLTGWKDALLHGHEIFSTSPQR